MGLPNRNRHVAAGAALALSFTSAWARGETARAAAGVELTLATDGSTKEQERALAHGQTDADAEELDPGPLDPAIYSRGAAGGGLAGTFGRVFTERVADGWYGRLELEGLVAGRYEGAGAVGGVTLGGELWLADGASGGGLPFSFLLGYRTPGLIGCLGVGALMFELDEVDGDRGFGIYAPFASARLGIELGGTRLLADARALYRWQWGAPDRAQLQVGLSMVHFIERPLSAPKRSPKRH